MANLKKLDSLGGFSLGNTTIVSDTNDAKNLNTLELKINFLPIAQQHIIFLED